MIGPYWSIPVLTGLLKSSIDGQGGPLRRAAAQVNRENFPPYTAKVPRPVPITLRRGRRNQVGVDILHVIDRVREFFAQVHQNIEILSCHTLWEFAEQYAASDEHRL